MIQNELLKQKIEFTKSNLQIVHQIILTKKWWKKKQTKPLALSSDSPSKRTNDLLI